MKTILVALKLLLVMTIITGVIYPLFLTFVAKVAFPDQASGSMVVSGGQTIGSQLIAQKFESDRYFWARPSAVDYNPLPSGGSNLGYTSGDLQKAVADRGAKLTQTGELVSVSAIPVDLLFASGSGLDPHLSPEGARFQVDRIARARGLDAATAESVNRLIGAHTENRTFGLFGEPRVNVLLLNVALDSLTAKQ